MGWLLITESVYPQINPRMKSTVIYLIFMKQRNNKRQRIETSHHSKSVWNKGTSYSLINSSSLRQFVCEADQPRQLVCGGAVQVQERLQPVYDLFVAPIQGHRQRGHRIYICSVPVPLIIVNPEAHWTDAPMQLHANPAAWCRVAGREHASAE